MTTKKDDNINSSEQLSSSEEKIETKGEEDLLRFQEWLWWPKKEKRTVTLKIL